MKGCGLAISSVIYEFKFNQERITEFAFHEHFWLTRFQFLEQDFYGKYTWILGRKEGGGECKNSPEFW